MADFSKVIHTYFVELHKHHGALGIIEIVIVTEARDKTSGS